MSSKKEFIHQLYATIIEPIREQYPLKNEFGTPLPLRWAVRAEKDVGGPDTLDIKISAYTDVTNPVVPFYMWYSNWRKDDPTHIDLGDYSIFYNTRLPLPAEGYKPEEALAMYGRILLDGAEIVQKLKKLDHLVPAEAEKV